MHRMLAMVLSLSFLACGEDPQPPNPTPNPPNGNPVNPTPTPNPNPTPDPGPNPLPQPTPDPDLTRVVSGSTDSIGLVIEWLGAGAPERRIHALDGLMRTGSWWDGHGFAPTTEQIDSWGRAVGRAVSLALYDPDESVRARARSIVEQSVRSHINWQALGEALDRASADQLGMADGVRIVIDHVRHATEPAGREALVLILQITMPTASAGEALGELMDLNALPAELLRIQPDAYLADLWARAEANENVVPLVLRIVAEHGDHFEGCTGNCISTDTRTHLQEVSANYLSRSSLREPALRVLLCTGDPRGLQLLAELSQMGVVGPEFDRYVLAMGRHDPAAFVSGWMACASDDYTLEDCVAGLLRRKDLLPPLDLNGYGDQIARLLDSSDEGARTAADAIGGFRITTATDALATWITDRDDWDSGLRAYAVSQLAVALGPEGVERLWEMRQTRERRIRRAVAVAVAHMGDERPLGSLARALATPEIDDMTADEAHALASMLSGGGLVASLPRVFAEVGDIPLDGRALIARRLFTAMFFRSTGPAQATAHEQIELAARDSEPAVVIGAIGAARDGVPLNPPFRDGIVAALRNGDAHVRLHAVVFLALNEDAADAPAMVAAWDGLTADLKSTLNLDERERTEDFIAYLRR